MGLTRDSKCERDLLREGLITGFEDGSECRWPIGVEWPLAGRLTETSVLHLQGTEFCHNFLSLEEDLEFQIRIQFSRHIDFFCLVSP